MTDATKSSKRASAAKTATPPTTDAQRRAAVILEVLAGVRTAQEAADVLKISCNHYYLLERKAALSQARCEVQEVMASSGTLKKGHVQS